MSLIAICKMFILKYGLISVFFTSLLEYLCIPIPSEVILPFVGAMAASNKQSILLIMVIAVVGGSIGSLVMFMIGKYIGCDIIKWIGKKYPKSKESVEDTKTKIYKYRYIGVFMSRILPMARTFTSLIAGMIEMKPGRFTFFSALGMIIWDYTLLRLGYEFSNNQEVISEMFRKYSIIIVLIVISIVIVVIILLIVKRNKNLNNKK